MDDSHTTSIEANGFNYSFYDLDVTSDWGFDDAATTPSLGASVSQYSADGEESSFGCVTPGTQSVLSPALSIELEENMCHDPSVEICHPWDESRRLTIPCQPLGPINGYGQGQGYLNPSQLNMPDPGLETALGLGNYETPSTISYTAVLPAPRPPRVGKSHSIVPASRPRQTRNKGPVQCPTCGDSFPRPTELHKHEKWHTKPYRCLACGLYSSDRQKGLNRHQTVHHPALARDRGLSTSPVACPEPECTSSVRRRDNLKRHLREKHGYK